jgi:hypothetical protein
MGKNSVLFSNLVGSLRAGSNTPSRKIKTIRGKKTLSQNIFIL